MSIYLNKAFGIIAILSSFYTNELVSRELTDEEYRSVIKAMEQAGGKAWHAAGTVHRNNDVYDGTAYIIDQPREVGELCLAPAVFMTAKANSVKELSWQPSPNIRYHVWFKKCLEVTEENSTVLYDLIAAEALVRIKSSESLLYSEGLKFLRRPGGYDTVSTPRLARVGLQIDDAVGIVYTAGFEVKECLGLDVNFTFKELEPVVLNAWKVLC